jgi:hypothetical protein
MTPKENLGGEAAVKVEEKAGYVQLGAPRYSRNGRTDKNRTLVMTAPQPTSALTLPPPKNFGELTYPLLVPLNNREVACQPPAKFLSNHDYSEVFLSHARLYSLAHYWMIDSLKALSLRKLHKTLQIFKLDHTNIPQVLALAKYAYREEGNEAMRDLICRFLVLHVVALMADEGFVAMMREGGEFMEDMWRYEVQLAIQAKARG